MARIIHFEIPADNPETSIQFYQKAFGWQINNWGDQEYWMATTGTDNEPGINGAIMKKRDPLQPVTITIGVDNIDEAIKSVELNGGAIVFPKTVIPAMGYYAYFKDPDGNIIGLMQNDPAAK